MISYENLLNWQSKHDLDMTDDVQQVLITDHLSDQDNVYFTSSAGPDN
jgi:hypothetical protein